VRYSRSADSVDCGLISQKTFRRWMRCFSYSIVCGINIYIYNIYIYIYSSCTTPLHYCISVNSSQTLLRCYHIFLCFAVLMLASWNFPWPQSCVFSPFRPFLGPCCVCCLSFYFGSLCISFYPFFLFWIP
jgi:hypothetical protein